MLLSNLFSLREKNYKKIIVKGISFDSRKIKKKDVFFAIDGNKTSGTKFIASAIAKGASAVICEKNYKFKNFNKPIITVKNVRESLSTTCAKFYKEKPKNIIAVTGTNGKSSVADFYYQIMKLNKVPAASIGTLGICSKKFNKKTNLTSMDPLSLHKNLQILAKKKINNVILEASSHGLDQRRLNGINIKTGIFTNLSHDHLDYHKNMKLYLNSKMYLFKKLLKKKSQIITDEDIKEFKIIKNIAKKRKLKKITIGSKLGNIQILKNKYKQDYQIITISVNSKIFLIKVPLVGYFQIKNLLMAILAAVQSGVNKDKILKNLKKIKPVTGRLECVAKIKNNSRIIVDFAHTPDALEKSLTSLKEHFKKDILIVFGCGGDRDKKKRIKMGKVAQKYCRKIFITDDNPRFENPKKIRKEILKGCNGKALDIADRKKAIKLAIKELKSNEVLLVAGKGHENTQNYGNKILNFSDKKVIKEIIKKQKFLFKKKIYKNFLLAKALNRKNLGNFTYSGISINSKAIKKNNLFFAIKGKKNDGHRFAKEALKKGAIKSVIDRKIKKIPKNKIIRVKNTFSLLNSLAKITRNNTGAEIIAITGSAGKTTLKNLISFALKNYGKVYHSPHSYNNKYGVPFSVSNLKENTNYGIFEIGMDKKGEIDNLSKIVRPEIAVITNIGGAHFKNFKSLKDIAKAKGEIINNISTSGNIILNKEDKFFNYFSKKAKKKGVKVISFSALRNADVFLLSKKRIKKQYRLKIKVKKRIFYFDIKFLNNNFINNILACISVMYALNLNLNNMRQKFIQFNLPSGRGDLNIVNKFNKKFKFIDESYNANPLSMELAIKNLKYYNREKNSKKLVLLGDMLELGKKTKKFHIELSNVINKSDIDKVFVYGNHIKETFKNLKLNKRGKFFNKLEDAHDYFSKNLHNNDLLMIKGSNATGLNKFSRNIKKD